MLPTLCSKILHALIEAEYIWVSYGGAEATSVHDILVNGQSFWVRRSLFSILQQLQKD